ncbi:MAG: hypothetical protein LJE64_01555 [Desulfofustis sp.]|nr:hypothetical protein [Desulfofustis sp.]
MIVALLNLACTSDKAPEVIGLEFVQRAESLIEEGSIRGLNDLVSSDYHDSDNRDRRDILGIASAYLIATGSLHLFTDLKSAQFAGGGRLQCTLLVAFAAVPVEDRNLLPGINADLYWFDIELIEEQRTWKVVSAAWEQAMLDDFFGDRRTR